MFYYDVARGAFNQGFLRQEKISVAVKRPNEDKAAVIAHRNEVLAHKRIIAKGGGLFVIQVRDKSVSSVLLYYYYLVCSSKK